MNKLNKSILYILLLSCFLSSQPKFNSNEAGLSEKRLKNLEILMNGLVEEGKIAGFQSAIMRKGVLGHYSTYGYADIDNKILLKDDNIFRIYSMTKPIVSIALMMLHEEGKFLLDDPLHKYIPEMKNLKVYKPIFADGIFESTLGSIWPLNKIRIKRKVKNPILILDLLRHTSGLGYGWGPNSYVDRKYKKAKILNPKNNKEFIKIISDLPLYHEPGSGWRYSVSTDVCGYLIEVLSGQKLDKFLSDRIFKPLGMVDTHFQLPKNKVDRFSTNYINNVPKKYRWLLGKSFNPEGKLIAIDPIDSSQFARKVDFLSGGGGLLSTTKDYLQFCQMILNKGIHNKTRFLSPKTIELITQDHLKYLPYKGGPIKLPNNGTGFGLGFSITKNIAEKQLLSSAGSHGWGGAAGTFFIIDPKENLICILMIQLMDFDDLKISERFQTMVYQSIID